MSRKVKRNVSKEATSVFTQPRRRNVRQRSGFKVSGGKTGSECFIYTTNRYTVTGKELSLNFSDPSFKFQKSFSENIFLYGFGLYIISDKELLVSGSIQILNLKKNGNQIVAEHEQMIPKNIWTRIGFHLEDDSIIFSDNYKAVIKLNIFSQKENPNIEFFGLQFGPINYYKDRKTYKGNFYEKTELYKPEIYYLPFRKIEIKNAEDNGTGIIIGKSCNRCARFLPIDIGNELNPLGFSNHCKKRAPCKHNAFSKYLIENPEIINELSNDVKERVVLINGHYLFTTHFGFQLECRSCKKFEVNAPLNPLRNKAQHHEDGARRRAFERMIIELTKRDVVKNFRVTHKEEFQNYIWRIFKKSCFSCGKSLPKVADMDIDHTLPLSYLWPLNETATCLCKACNSLKHDLFPSEFSFYATKKLKVLSRITGIPESLINSKKRIVNPEVVKLLTGNAKWLFDDFLARRDYQKIKKGKRVADLIYKALQKVLVPENIDLIKVYFKGTGKYPQTITLK